MLEVIIEHPELEVDGRIIPGESWAWHPEEVEADDHGIGELHAPLLGPAANREAPQGVEARHGDGEGPGVEPLPTLPDLTLIDKALVKIIISSRAQRSAGGLRTVRGQRLIYYV